MKLKRFLSYEWEAIIGHLATVTAVIMHLLNGVIAKSGRSGAEWPHS